MTAIMIFLPGFAFGNIENLKAAFSPTSQRNSWVYYSSSSADNRFTLARNDPSSVFKICPPE
jgi:hypothetical protein